MSLWGSLFSLVNSLIISFYSNTHSDMQSFSPTGVAGPEFPAQQSSRAFRRSCDRCHSQKLKCTGLSPGELRTQCTRCQQAGLSCVYSKRRPKRHRQNMPDDRHGTSHSIDVPRRASLRATPAPHVITSRPPSASRNQDAFAPLNDMRRLHSTHLSQSDEALLLEEPRNNLVTPPMTYPTATLQCSPHRAKSSSWPLNGIFSDNDANSREMFSDIYNFENSLDKIPSPESSSTTSSIDEQMDDESVPGTSQVTGLIHNSFESISDISQELESILDTLLTQWCWQDVWKCKFLALVSLTNFEIN